MTTKLDMLAKLQEQDCLDNSDLLEDKKEKASTWFAKLRNEICKSFEEIENSQLNKNTKINFVQKKWKRDGGGGGIISIMKGKIFEKVGVNISTVYGNFSKEFRGQIPGAEENGAFWASGISVVSHMCNPHIPAAHMNTRLLVTGEGDKKKIWFGGGGDLTPTFEDFEVTKLFHQDLKISCDRYDNSYYPKFKNWCDEYFFLPHREEARGVGGIFLIISIMITGKKIFYLLKMLAKHFYLRIQK